MSSYKPCLAKRTWNIVFTIIFYLILGRILNPLLRRRGNFFFFSSNRPWSGNSKAVCDAATNNDRVKKIVILNTFSSNPDTVSPTEAIRDQYKHCTKPIVILENKYSLKTFFHIMTCDVAFYHNSSRKFMRLFSVNLWHGIPIKKIGIYQQSDRKNHDKVIPIPFIKQNYRISKLRPNTDRLHNRGIASSVTDHVMMSSCFGVPPKHVYNSGLPRNDWLLESNLPDDLASVEQRIRDLCGDKKLCLYAPTFRDDNKTFCPMTPEQLQEFAHRLGEAGYVLGVRPHISIPDNFYHQLDNVIDLSITVCTEIQVLLRIADMLVTDYSSCSVDYMLCNKPILSYAPDIDDYLRIRGFFYDFKTVFPGLIKTDFNDFLETICAIAHDSEQAKPALARIKQILPLFHQERTGSLSMNLVNQILDDRERYIN